MKIVINNQKIELQIANSFLSRLKGFMFKKKIHTAIRFQTKSIHTFFMKEEIDVLITDKENKILAYYKNLEKNKIIYNFKAYYIYELPKNSIKKIKAGDTLIVI